MSAADPLVSIITPSYNQGRYLAETIQSVLTQDYPHIEYLVIDGGSTDGSLDIIRKNADHFAYWVSEPDQGQAHAINKGFRRAKGSILAWLNSDDAYRPGAVQQAVAALTAHSEHDLAYANCDYVDAAGALIQTVTAWDFVPRRLLTGIPLVIQPASFFRRRALDKVGLLNESLRYLMDHDLFVRMVVAELTFWRADTVWARFRLHAGSKTQTQWIGFNLELQQIIAQTFTSAQASAQPRWRPEAEANAWQSLGEAYLANGERRQAKKSLLAAIRACPWRPKTGMTLALLSDATLGTHLARQVRRWRYRLPDAPVGARPFESPDA